MARLAEAAGWAPSALDPRPSTAAKTTSSSSQPHLRTGFPKTIAGVAVHSIGVMSKRRKSKPVMTLHEPGHADDELSPKGWEHFR